MKLQRFSYISGACLGFLAVLIGAFGAHGLEPILSENNRQATFETANYYHFLHALVLLFIGFFKGPEALMKTISFASRFMVLGVVVFSGSLYLLSITNVTWLGAITPIGGLFFLIAWGLLIKSGFQLPNQ